MPKSKFSYVVTLLFTDTVTDERYEKPLRILTEKDYIDVIELTNGIDETLNEMDDTFKYNGLKENNLSEIHMFQNNGFKS